MLNYSIANCYDACSQLNKAKIHYEQAIQLRQDYAEAYNNHGNVCRKLGEYALAEKSLFHALRLFISVDTLGNIGLLMTELRKPDIALSYYNHALQLDPGNCSILWNKSLLLLSQKQWQEGWRLYDYGLLAKTRPKQITPPEGGVDTYSASYFKNKVIFIHREQGIGDEIMFASCFPEMINLAKHCYIEADSRLVPLFRRVFNRATVVPHSELLVSNDFHNNELADIHISSASIPRFLRNHDYEFTKTNAYLSPKPELIQNWKTRINQLGEGLKIGVSWRGGIGEQSLKRSADLHWWNQLLQLDDCQFVNLQYGNVDDELDTIQTTIHEWIDTDHFHNMEELAAQISSLDLVITVSNVTAHLAGALGKPLWIILPYASNWRWLNGENPSLWYPSARLFSQPKPGQWQPVFDELLTELSTLKQKAAKLNQQTSLVPC